jgi:hypothetical protein
VSSLGTSIRILNHKTGSNAHNWKGGTRLHTAGYVLIYSPNHPFESNSYVMQHRLVMEKHIGRFLKENEIVHQINSNKQDNRIENLKLMTQREHMRKDISYNEIRNFRRKWNWLFGSN